MSLSLELLLSVLKVKNNEIPLSYNGNSYSEWFLALILEWLCFLGRVEASLLGFNLAWLWRNTIQNLKHTIVFSHIKFNSGCVRACWVVLPVSRVLGSFWIFVQSSFISIAAFTARDPASNIYTAGSKTEGGSNLFPIRLLRSVVLSITLART